MDYIADATAQVLRDVDTLTDWIYAECMLAEEVSERPRIKEASAEDFKHLTVPQLVALLFDAGQPANVTQAARDEISNRYLAQPSTRARIDKLADRAEDDHERECFFDRLMGNPLREFPAFDRRAA